MNNSNRHKYVSRQESTLGRRRSNIPSLVCAFSASATTGGTIYAFGVFAKDLKLALQLTQMQLGNISAALFIAGLLSWLPGLVVDRMKMRFSMSLGGVSGAVFTTMYWLLCRHPSAFPIFQQHPVSILSLLAVAICLSCGLIVGSVFKLTMLCGGPDGKGPSVGVAKGFVGLGSGIYATIFQAFRSESESGLDFLPVIAFFFLVCATLPALMLLPTREQSHPHLMNMETTHLHFRTMYGSLFILCLFIIGSALTDIWWEPTSLQPKRRSIGKVILILLLWLGPIASLLVLPRKKEQDDEKTEASEITSLVPNPNECSPLSFSSTPEEDGTLDQGDHNEAIQNSWRAVQEEEQQHGYGRNKKTQYKDDSVSMPMLTTKNVVVDFRADLSLPEMLRTPSAWLMLWICLCLVGSGTCKTNNMGQMVESLEFADSVTPATLALFSVAQAASRILTGILSEAVLHWNPFPGVRSTKGIPRPYFLIVASTVSLLAHLVLASSTSLKCFVIGCSISAVAFGMAWPLMVLIVGDVYGVEHHGANYMFYDGGTKALGTLLLSEYLAGTVYEAHIEDNGGSSERNTCIGAQCFQITHLVIACLSVVCIFASFLLCYQTRHTYYT